MTNNSIPKTLYMIWLGDNLPKYHTLSLSAYKYANPKFNIESIQFSLEHIKDIYYGKIITPYEQLLYDSINLILSNDKQSIFSDIITHQIKIYGKQLRFIQLLSDIYRLKLILTYGGIYVDCDTFPLKPFDKKLLSLGNFIVSRHYKTTFDTINNIGLDNYFFGSVPNINLMNTSLLQTNNKWWSNIEYLKNKQLFYTGKLVYTQKITPFYIEHYSNNNWNTQENICTPKKCFLDKLFLQKNII